MQGDLVADFEYDYCGVGAKGLTLKQFARALIAQGHDRHGVLSLLDRDPETTATAAATARDVGGAAPTSSAPPPPLLPAIPASLPQQCRSDAADGAALPPTDGVVAGVVAGVVDGLQHPTLLFWGVFLGVFVGLTPVSIGAGAVVAVALAKYEAGVAGPWEKYLVWK